MTVFFFLFFFFKKKSFEGVSSNLLLRRSIFIRKVVSDTLFVGHCPGGLTKWQYPLVTFRFTSLYTPRAEKPFFTTVTEAVFRLKKFYTAVQWISRFYLLNNVIVEIELLNSKQKTIDRDGHYIHQVYINHTITDHRLK